MHYLHMEWIWVGLLFLIMFGPIVLMLIRRRRREFEDPRWPRG